MLHRQKVLLQLLRVANRSVTRFELTKWSFLLRKEFESAGGSAFYDFVPYRLGPFSFALYQELDKLALLSYVEAEGKKSVRLDEASIGLDRLGPRVEKDIAQLFRRVRNFSRNQLIDYVYENHPSYTFNSEIRQLVPRPLSSPQVFTAGYEGRSVDGFLNLLMQAGVSRLIDVRMNPIARRYGFHKSTLNRLCGKLDIDYQHFPTLGIRSEKRQGLRTQADYNALFDDYEASTLQTESEAIDKLTKLVAEQPSVLVCMEAEHTCCHRSRLAAAVARRSRLPIINLGSSDG